jgi:hypothetical protein
MTEQVLVTSRNDLRLNNRDIGSTSTFYDQYGVPPRNGAYDDRFYFCSFHCPGSGETDAIQILFRSGVPVLHPNWVVYKCGGITVDGY